MTPVVNVVIHVGQRSSDLISIASDLIMWVGMDLNWTYVTHGDLKDGILWACNLDDG